MPTTELETSSALSVEDRLEIYQKIYLTRRLDDKLSSLGKQNKGGTFHLCHNGHELIGIMAARALEPGRDWGLPYYRDRGFAIGIGAKPTDLIASFLARDSVNHSGGRCMPEHYSEKNLRLPIQSSCVGSQFLQAVGVAKGASLRGSDEVVYVSGGDGSTSQGDLHEALNFSALHKLGVLFVIHDNGWAISTPREEQTGARSIEQMLSGYANLMHLTIDGTDPDLLHQTFEQAVSHCRTGAPALIVAKVPRIGAHSSSDDPKKYQDIEHFEEASLNDPLKKLQIALEGSFKAEIEEKIDAEIARAAKEAEQIPHPKPESVEEFLYAPENQIEVAGESLEAVVMVDAINHALVEEMDRDEGVVVFGQDVAHGKGGVFGVTAKLTELYGKERCFNTPLAESTIIAIAMGMSFDGFHHPVAEIQFADYIWTGINQLFNELGSAYYRSKGMWNCPVVVRMPCGGYIQGGPYHSQSIEAFLAHAPGLTVVMPSNSRDAKMLMKAAIRSPNPVVFLEHKAVYRQRTFAAKPEPSAEAILPLGKAAVIKEGKDLTLVTWSYLTTFAAELAAKLTEEGIDIEVIDLRTIKPLDWETIKASVQKTNRLLIAHEAPLFCGFGAEIAAKAADLLFEDLDAPIKRLGGLNVPIPYAKPLENAALPQKKDLEKAIRELYAY